MATQIGSQKENITIPKSVNQVRTPGIISKNRWIFFSLGSLVLGLGKENFFSYSVTLKN